MEFQTLNLKVTTDENLETKKTEIGFWKRQFQVEPTKKQRIFDWMFGVVLPVICFVADPILFKGYGLGKGAIMGSVKPFAYLLSFTLVMILSANLIWNERLKWIKPFLSGLFVIGAIISFGIGIILLPLSLIGLAFVIGILGFTPLFSGFVYLRNSIQCFNSAKSVFKKSSLIGGFILSAVLSFTIPMLVNIEIQKSLNAMKNGDVKTIIDSENRLKFVSPLVNFDELGGLYCGSPDSDEHQSLARVYEKYTGESIERIDFHICNDW